MKADAASPAAGLKPLAVVHLTFTGRFAGQTFCGGARKAGALYHHPRIDLLDDPAYRAGVCPACLRRWDDAAPPAERADR